MWLSSASAIASIPSSRAAETGSTGGTQAPSADGSRVSIARSSETVRSAPSRSALLTTCTSAISRTPALERLNVVAETRDRDDDDRLRETHHVDLVLSDADGLDEHEPEARRVHQVDRVGGRARQTAQGTTCGHRADEDAGVERQVAHADAIAEDRAAGERRGRVDREDSDGTAARPRDQRERPREGALLPLPGAPVTPTIWARPVLG